MANTLQSCNFPSQLTTSFNGTDYTFDVVCANNKLLLNGPGFTLSNTDVEVTNINIYPNPTTDKITLKTQSGFEGNWALYNQLGQRVLTGSIASSNHDIDIQELNKGLYILQVKDMFGSTKTIEKIIKE